MNKADLVKLAAANADLTQRQVEAVLDALIDTIINAVADGDKVLLVGFGTFEAAQRSAREGRNPQTGEVIDIPATTVPKFSAGKAFKEAVANHA